MADAAAGARGPHTPDAGAHPLPRSTRRTTGRTSSSRPCAHCCPGRPRHRLHRGGCAPLPQPGGPAGPADQAHSSLHQRGALDVPGGWCLRAVSEARDNTCYLGAKSKQWGKETPCWPCRAAAVLLCWAGFTFIAGGIFSRDTGGDTVSNLLYRCDRHYSRGSRWLP